MWDSLLANLAQQGGDDWCPPCLPDDPEWADAPEHIQAMLREKRHQRLWKEEGLLPRPCLLHRLDKDTSGIIALARTERARRYIIRQFEQHTIVKRYLAVVQKGAFDWSHPRITFNVRRRKDGEHETQVNLPFDLSSLGGDELLLDGPLQRDPADRHRCIIGPDGKPAITKVNLLFLMDDFALLEVYPITGRMHQIRAHLAALGYAIVGDQVYAPVAEKSTPHATLKRQFLHAYSLELRRYPDNMQCRFVAPLAGDLVTWLKQHFPSEWIA